MSYKKYFNPAFLILSAFLWYPAADCFAIKLIGSFGSGGVAGINAGSAANVKLLAFSGQTAIGKGKSNSVELKSGLIYAGYRDIIYIMASIPYMKAITASKKDSAQLLADNLPTNYSTPVFSWEPAVSVSTVTAYSYKLTKDGSVLTDNVRISERFIGNINFSENGFYSIYVKAVNETGNWSPPAVFNYIFDTAKPLPRDIVGLQGWESKYFHPLTVDLSFAFSENLSGVNADTLVLQRNLLNNDSEAVAGEVKYLDASKTIQFVPQAPLKALSSYSLKFKNVRDLAGNEYSGDINFNTFLGKAMSAEVYSRDGKVKLAVPVWAVEAEESIITIEKISEPLDVISKADRKVELRLNMRLVPSDAYKIEILDLNSGQRVNFSKEAEVFFDLPDSDSDGLWDGSEIRLKDISLAMLDEANKDWAVLNTAPSERSKSAPADSTGVSYSIKEGGIIRLVSYMAPSDGAGNVLIYPVPFRPKLGHSEITFLRLPLGSEIKIYNIAGELVKYFENPGQGHIVWDGRNTNGEEIASGVYLAVIKCSSSQKIYKFAVER